MQAFAVWPIRAPLNAENICYYYFTREDAERAIEDTGEPRSDWAVLELDREQDESEPVIHEVDAFRDVAQFATYLEFKWDCRPFLTLSCAGGSDEAWHAWRHPGRRQFPDELWLTKPS